MAGKKERKNSLGVWVAEMTTEHYAWRAFGRTQAEARRGIARMWNNTDVNEYVNAPRERMSAARLNEYYGIYAYKAIPGKCLLDFESYTVCKRPRNV